VVASLKGEGVLLQCRAPAGAGPRASNLTLGHKSEAMSAAHQHIRQTWWFRELRSSFSPLLLLLPPPPCSPSRLERNNVATSALRRESEQTNHAVSCTPPLPLPLPPYTGPEGSSDTRFFCNTIINRDQSLTTTHFTTSFAEESQPRGVLGPAAAPSHCPQPSQGRRPFYQFASSPPPPPPPPSWHAPRCSCA